MTFWLYNPCITEMKISTILTHNIRRISLCGLFHLAEGQCCGTTDRSHTYEVRADIWLYPPLASLLKHTSAEHSELATEVTLKHTHTHTHSKTLLYVYGSPWRNEWRKKLLNWPFWCKLPCNRCIVLQIAVIILELETLINEQFSVSISVHPGYM